MGYIVKAGESVDSALAARPRDPCPSDSLASQVTETVLAARVAADAEWAAAQGAAPVLARKMAEKIIGHAVDLDARVMADIAEQALHACRGRGATVALRVHPDDRASLEAAKPGWLARQDGPAEIVFVADDTVGRYGCVVETPAGRVDARLQTQLDVLERVLGAAKRGG